MLTKEVKQQKQEITGSTDQRRFKNFQIRWAERCGEVDSNGNVPFPYLIRWTFLLFGFSMRIHHWIKSDDNRYFHDHSADLLSIVLYGRYYNVKPYDPSKNPTDLVDIKVGKGDDGEDIIRKGVNKKFCYVEGIFNSWKNFLHMGKSIWFSKAEDCHYLQIPKEGAWTLMFESRPRHKWGFYVNGHRWRTKRYFSKFGVRQTRDYQ